MEGKDLRRWHMDEVLFFHVALEPHLKHSGSITGGRILFLAEVPVDAAKKTATNPEDENALRQAAERLAAELLPIAMTGHPKEAGEDIMRFSCHSVPRPSEDLLEHAPDAEKSGVRLWLLGAKV
jgi:hypothetical protein